MSVTLDLAKKLIEKASVTPNDAGCQSLISEYLQSSGFEAEVMPFGDVTNLWLRRGDESPLFVFAGHTASCLASRLYCRQKKCHQDANNGNNDQ